MTKYILEVTNGQKNTAGQKAKEDISTILSNDAFQKVSINIPESKIQKLFVIHRNVSKLLENFNKDDVFIIQYPMYSKHALALILKECKRQKVTTIGFIHDVESLRFNSSKVDKTRELNLFKKFDGLIVHNEIMNKWIKENVNNAPYMVNLQIFDYLSNQTSPTIKKNLGLVFAGNLGKATFLNKWNLDLDIDLYGVNPSENYSSSVHYKGIKNPDELPKFLNGSFGLVWDGDSLITGSGDFAEYTRYNNPHKVSLYLSCGLPVIVWKEAAIASFIEKKNLGVTVTSLDDLQEILNSVTDAEYAHMLDNVSKISNELKKGYYTKKAVAEIISSI